MTPLNTINLLRALFVVMAASLGGMVGAGQFGNFFGGFALGAVYALCLVLVDRLLRGLTLRAFSSATFGLLLGFIFSMLFRESNVFMHQSADTQWLIGLALYAGFGYLGMMLAMRSNRDEFSLLIPYVRFTRERTQDLPLLLDTNAVIDSRVGDVIQTGFLSGELIVPRFIMEEVQRLADSNDPIRRERGRRGLENVERLQRSPGTAISFHDSVRDPETPVDVQLVNIARLMQARILSGDVSLCKAARVQGVLALNLSDLARAVRTQLNVGDEVELQLTKEGKDASQGVGYLPDGTMIVVNQGRPYIGQTIGVVVSGTVMTSAGRLIFADVRK